MKSTQKIKKISDEIRARGELRAEILGEISTDEEKDFDYRVVACAIKNEIALCIHVIKCDSYKKAVQIQALLKGETNV